MANKMYKVQVHYPCQWLYKVIGFDPTRLQQALLEIVTDDSCNISYSKGSSTGKYHCLNLEVTVQDEEQRNAIYLALKEHPEVKIVL